MPRPGILFIGVALTMVVLLCFVWPQAMLAPGRVHPAHAEIAQDCFACHAPLQGASAARCINCHVPARIGKFTTKGLPIPVAKAGFHQRLIEPDCTACHSDHAGPALTGHSPTAFSHRLLQPAVRSQCATCHKPPTGPLHGPLHKTFAAASCSTCHDSSGWKPARFSHTLLTPVQRGQCETCHTAPSNAFHRQIGTLGCAQCHSTIAWEPATFDHGRWFRLDGDHNVPCATCHLEKDHARYTCYGCHEHDRGQVLREHREEGVRGNIDNCVRCHRSSSGEGGERRESGDDD